MRLVVPMCCGEQTTVEWTDTGALFLRLTIIAFGKSGCLQPLRWLARKSRHCVDCVTLTFRDPLLSDVNFNS